MAAVLSTEASILYFEFKVIFILSPPPGCAPAIGFHKDMFMYVCMCGGEHGELLERAAAISSGICGA